MKKICIIGLGYVGRPLAELFATKYDVVGFDTDTAKIEKIKADNPPFLCTDNPEEIAGCNFYIIAVPTPVDKNYCPDLKPLLKATETVGKILKQGDFVIYESTVYPGVTEDECVPVLENVSGKKLNIDFFVGYSPERINPGDKVNTTENIVKITSGSSSFALEIIDSLYNSVLKNGTYKAPTIKVAEAAKIIENCQRDVNIAFMNEIAKIFNAAGIDTQEVIKAASTKWNFLKFSPGLVGGHCISVDPYYLIQQAKVYGVLPRVMTAARQLNDGMGSYVAENVITKMNKKGILIKGADILILGFSFKENCPDIRNTKVIDIYHTLYEYDTFIDVVDPIAEKDCSIRILNEIPNDKKYDAIILAVPHKEFLSINVENLRKELCVVADVKGVWEKEEVDFRL